MFLTITPIVHRNSKSTSRHIRPIAIGVVVIFACIVVGCAHYKSYRASTDSMAPTVKKGQVVTIDPNAYSHITDIKRWDLIALKRPKGWHDPNPYVVVRRVVGLPGETIHWQPNGLSVDGKSLKIPKHIRKCYGNLRHANAGIPSTGTVILSNNEFFVMGDHQQTAADSRLYGPTHWKNVIGEVVKIQ